MSHRAVRITDASRVEEFSYGHAVDPQGGGAVTPAARPRSAQIVPFSGWTLGGAPASPSAGVGAPPATRPVPPAGQDGGAAEEDQAAFARGYAQGECAALDLATRQLAGLRDRLGRTLADLGTLRADLTSRVEHQVVDLALAVATRILHREVSLDRELLLVMARIALDRLGDATAATIRLHPEDETAARGQRDQWPGGSVTIVADPSVRPGACVVQTSQGTIEAGVDAQIRELATTLLGDGEGPHAGALRHE
jgi:flagellar biosynthesis/type III secretory pathway protein FliH